MVTYKDAGVDMDVADRLIDKLKVLCPEIGGFGGLYPLGEQYLVSGTDGVGTKLKIAFATNKHDTIGIDLVAMSVNDILTSGAKPLFFLDYFATGKLEMHVAEKVLAGIVAGCHESECVLLGGETAEMPGMYAQGEYDLAGFAVGIVNKDDLVDGRSIKVGDKLVGIPSSGFHSNGYSLIRKVLEVNNISLNSESVKDALLTPTRIYVREVLQLLKEHAIKGMAHITGGGMTENIPRILPQGMGVTIHKGTWNIPKEMTWLQDIGQISEVEMYRTFNMGIGFIMVVDPETAAKLSYSIIGEVTEGQGVVYQ
jgi:phosphoribosylformylglycinamidine cyclo-ligase